MKGEGNETAQWGAWSLLCGGNSEKVSTVGKVKWNASFSFLSEG